MAQNKENPETNKPEVKVQDLAPKKDAKGGVARNQNAANPNSMDQNSVGQNATGQNRFDANQNSGRQA